MDYDTLIKSVNARYQELKGNDEFWIHDQLKREFELSTSELWEVLGIKDLFDDE
jgi:hypothetical protein